MARNKRIEIRVDEEELRLIGVNAKEHRRTISDFVRESALGDRPERASDIRSEGGGATPPNPAAVSRGRITVPLAEDGAWDPEKQTFEHLPSPRSVRRCPSGCVGGVTSPAVTKCRVCNTPLVPS